MTVNVQFNLICLMTCINVSWWILTTWCSIYILSPYNQWSAKRTLKDTHALGFSCTTESTVAAMTALVYLQSRTSTFGDPDLSWIRHPHHTDRAVFACSISDLHHIYDFLHKIFYKLKLLFEAKFWKSSAFDMIHICFCFFFFFGLSSCLTLW